MRLVDRSETAVRLAAGFFGLLNLVACHPDIENDLWKELTKLLAESRPIEPQLSASLAWRPCVAQAETLRVLNEPSCGGIDSEPEHKPKTFVSRRETDVAASKEHARALSLLLEESDLTAGDQAIQELEILVQELNHPASAERASDLAAAYYLRAQRRNRPEDLVKALEAVEQALELDADLSAALFNQGLICSALEARRCAQEAWTRYLQVDSSSGWADEALTRLEALREREFGSDWQSQKRDLSIAVDLRDLETIESLVDRNRREVQTWIEGELLVEGFAQAISETSKALPKPLVRAQVLATTLESLGGDNLPAAAVAHAIEALGTKNHGSLKELAAGFADFAHGSKLFADTDQSRYQSAAMRFRSAQRRLASAGNPLSLRAQLALVASLYHLEQRATAMAHIDRFLADPSAFRYRSLYGRAHHLRGTIRLLKDQFSAALSDYLTALREYEALGLDPEVETLWVRIAQVRSAKLGQSNQAWQDLYRGLPAFHSRDAGRSLMVQSELVRAAQAIACSRAADRLNREPSRVKRKPAEEILYQLSLARSSRSLGRTSLAHQQVRRAKELLARFPEENKEPWLWLAEVEGQLHRESRPLEAARHFERAIELCRQADYPAFLSRLNGQLAEALVAAGRRSQARVVLDRAVTELNRSWHQQVAGRQSRVDALGASYFASNRASIELLANLLADDGQAEAGFGVLARIMHEGAESP